MRLPDVAAPTIASPMRVRFWTVSKLPDKCRQPRSIAVIMFTRVLLSNSDILAAHVFGGHRIDPVYRNSIWIGACRYSRRVCCEAPALPASEVLVCYGSWLCENAKLLDDDRRSYSSKTALGHQLAIAFNFKIELKNVILVAFRTFAFLHSQGQKLP